MWWQQLFGRKPKAGGETGEINIWRLQTLFNNFRRILHLNNAVLEGMAQLERALGGEYIFDRSFLETSIRNIASHVHHVTYNLNALTDNGYIALYDRYQEIHTILDDILSGNTRALDCPPVVALADIGWELEPLVGIDMVCLAELRHHPGIPVAEGFVITTEGTMALCGRTETYGVRPAHHLVDEVRAGLIEQLGVLLSSQKTHRLAVVVTQVDDPDEPVKELGRFSIVPAGRRFVLTIVEEGLPLTPGNSSIVDDDSQMKPEKGESITAATDDFAPDLYRVCLERIIGTVSARLRQEDVPEWVRFAVFVRCSKPIAIEGTVFTRDDAAEDYDMLTISASLPGKKETGNSYLLKRTSPFDLVDAKIPPRTNDSSLTDARLATEEPHSVKRMGAGSALLNIDEMKLLAETGMIMERMLGIPIGLQWQQLQDTTWVITRLFLRRIIEYEIPGDDLTKERESAKILCSGGQIVQAGIAAGSVVHVGDEMSPADFPAGAVAVARSASPQLTPILQRAAAILTEYGSPAGHLATVARELRLPAIFGVSGVLGLLASGTEVTVDAGEATVYQGIQPNLLRYGARGMNFSPTDPEYRVLRQLLRFIMPLHLVNPEAPDFSPQGCRSFHDIIHFCHERAVDELAHFQERRSGLGTIRTRRILLDVPMDIRVLDIGNGMSKMGNNHQPTVQDVTSEPFAVFLAGLQKPEAWVTDLPSLGMRDILSSMPQSMAMLSTPPEKLGENLAIIGGDYMNLSLRLGYHFSVVDAHLGSDEHRNYVYFRFAGGLADPERRGRRAKFISDVLRAMDFKVDVKGDLVVGRLKLAEKDILRSALFTLGALTAFSRQRDTGLYTDADVKALFTRFADDFLLSDVSRLSGLG
ncbi:MAG: PEP-utilizing enzyme [Pseudomonadota bacterium]